MRKLIVGAATLLAILVPYHRLGFSSSDYKHYRNRETGAARGIDSVLKEYTQNGKTVIKLITPNLVAKVKEHYGCDNLANAGLELEDYEGSGSAGLYSPYY